MFLCLIFAVTISVCFGSDITITPAPVFCGELPSTILWCLGNPKFLKDADGVSSSCGKELSECGKISCIFNNLGWLKDGKVEKQEIIAHYDQFAKDYPQWSVALQHAKTACLSADLPAQGAYLNCPAYDVMLCSLSSFVKNAQPKQWSTALNCQYPKQFAAVCPLCPSECFAPLVPYGSCNACLVLPRSP